MSTVTVKTKESKIETPLRIIDCGLTNYRSLLEKQYRLRDERHRNNIPNTVLITEHYPVITLGARQTANKLLADPGWLNRQNIDVVQTRRGGGATAHNPGQLVFYPILDLRHLRLGISEYIRKLETVGIELLAQLAIKAHRRKGLPGLWLANRKIASIGVRVSKSITYHGMAINIQNDLTIFDYIVPCGLDNIEITSVLKETAARYPISRLKQELARLLTLHFS